MSAGTDYERLRDALYELRGNSDIRFGWESDRVAAEAEAIFEALLGELVAVRAERDSLRDRAVCDGCGSNVDEAGCCMAECGEGEMIPASDLPSALRQMRERLNDERGEWAEEIREAEAALVAVREERDAALAERQRVAEKYAAAMDMACEDNEAEAGKMLAAERERDTLREALREIAAPVHVWSEADFETAQDIARAALSVVDTPQAPA